MCGPQGACRPPPNLWVPGSPPRRACKPQVLTHHLLEGTRAPHVHPLPSGCTQGNRDCKGQGLLFCSPKQRDGRTPSGHMCRHHPNLGPERSPHTLQPHPAPSPDSSTKPWGPRAMAARQSVHTGQVQAVGPPGPPGPRLPPWQAGGWTAPEAGSQRFAQGLTSAASSSCPGPCGSPVAQACPCLGL